MEIYPLESSIFFLFLLLWSRNSKSQCFGSLELSGHRWNLFYSVLVQSVKRGLLHTIVHISHKVFFWLVSPIPWVRTVRRLFKILDEAHSASEQHESCHYYYYLKRNVLTSRLLSVGWICILQHRYKIPLHEDLPDKGKIHRQIIELVLCILRSLTFFRAFNFPSREFPQILSGQYSRLMMIFFLRHTVKKKKYDLPTIAFSCIVFYIKSFFLIDFLWLTYAFITHMPQIT